MSEETIAKSGRQDRRSRHEQRKPRAAAATGSSTSPFAGWILTALFVLTVVLSPFLPAPLEALLLFWITGSALFGTALRPASAGVDGIAGELLWRVTCTAAGFFFLTFSLFFTVRYAFNFAGAPFILLGVLSVLAVLVRPVMERRFTGADFIRLGALAYLFLASVVLRAADRAPLSIPVFMESLTWNGPNLVLTAVIVVCGAGALFTRGENSLPNSTRRDRSRETMGQGVFAVLLWTAVALLLIKIRLPATAFALFSAHPDTWYHVLRARVYTLAPTEVAGLANPVSYTDSIIYPTFIMHISAAAISDLTRSLVADWARYYQPVLQTLALAAGVFLYSFRGAGATAVVGTAAVTMAVMLLNFDKTGLGWSFIHGTTSFVSQFYATCCLALFIGLMRQILSAFPQGAEAPGFSSWGSSGSREKSLLVLLGIAGITVTVWSHVLTTGIFFVGIGAAWLLALWRKEPVWKPIAWIAAGSGALFMVYLGAYVYEKLTGEVRYDLADQASDNLMSARDAGLMLWSGYKGWPVAVYAGTILCLFRDRNVDPVRHVLRISLLVASVLYLLLILGWPLSFIPGRLLPLFGICMMLMGADVIMTLWDWTRKFGERAVLARGGIAAACMVPVVLSFPYRPFAGTFPTPWQTVIATAEMRSCDTTAQSFNIYMKALIPNTGKAAFVVPSTHAGHWLPALTQDPVYLYNSDCLDMNRPFLDKTLRAAVEELKLPPEQVVIMWVTTDNFFVADRSLCEQAMAQLPASPNLHKVSPGNILIRATAAQIVSGTW